MNKILNKVDLAKDVTDVIDLPQVTVKKVIDLVWDIMKERLAGGTQVSIAGFGNFVVKQRAARTGRNPKTGEAIQIEATKAVVFKPAKQLKEVLNK